MLHFSCLLPSCIPLMLKLSSLIALLQNKKDTWLCASATPFTFLVQPFRGQRQARLGFVLRFTVDHYSLTLHTWWWLATYVATAALGWLMGLCLPIYTNHQSHTTYTYRGKVSEVCCSRTQRLYALVGVGNRPIDKCSNQ